MRDPKIWKIILLIDTLNSHNRHAIKENFRLNINRNLLFPFLNVNAIKFHYYSANSLVLSFMSPSRIIQTIENFFPYQFTCNFMLCDDYLAINKQTNFLFILLSSHALTSNKHTRHFPFNLFFDCVYFENYLFFFENFLFYLWKFTLTLKIFHFFFLFPH